MNGPITTRQLPAGQRHRLNGSVYALEVPGAPAGLFIRIGTRPRLRALPQATLAPATEAGLQWLGELASRSLAGQVYELVRLEP